MIRHTLSACVLGSALLAGVPAHAFELAHDNGTLTLPSAPKTVATFDLGVLDTLDALGVPVAGVPKSSYEGALSRYNSTPVIGTLFEPDYAALKQLKPDLIIASGRSRRAVPELSAIAPTVTLGANTDGFIASFKADTLALGKAFGKEAEAAAALDRIQKQFDALHRVNQGKTGAFLFVANKNVMAHAPGDRFGYAYELAGLTSVVPRREPAAAPATRPAAGSPEAKAAAAKRAEEIRALAQAEPDWLIVLDRGAINGAEKTAAATLAAHPEISRTRAFREGRVYYASPNAWYVVGTGLNNLHAISADMLQAMKKGAF
ncbi:MAG: ABC transporter substrate-binding protein [Pigmentiphaga sp.]|uniref:siderophore ABC transporter substrate-binding protein n=1 Tax=Pigmentiphaga sp. TaxID=1977564 RepID=UPI0029B97A19|nr:ABC transporter substrate-binding protein [Pigmentiphaga sp.]MDX3905879.1 ABC transporter substrate-binding protein [Pigmentiphaga sp.]